MPKLLVLFQSHRPDVVGLAEAAREGARGVRFAEVDLRCLAEPDGATSAPPQRTHRALGHTDDVAGYDGVILVVAGAEDDGALGRAVAQAGASLTDRVGSVLSAAAGAARNEGLWAPLTAMADRGMILVPAPFGEAGEPPAESARRLGRRVAEVIGWVTHARSHHHHEPHHHEHHHEHTPHGH